METEQKERLEQELRFLEESLEADIISRDEYLKGKERIEEKLKEVKRKKSKEGIKIRKAREKVGFKKDKEEKIDEEKETLGELEVFEEPAEINKKNETISEEYEEKEEREEKKEDISREEAREKESKGISEEEKPEEDVEEVEGIDEESAEEETEEDEKIEDKKEKKSKKWLKWAGFFIIIIILYFLFLFRGCSKEGKAPLMNNTATEIKPACVNEEDCQEAGKIGYCVKPNTTEAKCEFKEDVRVNLTLVNDESCKSCDTDRMMQVIKQLFPGVKERVVDYKSSEGMDLLKSLNIEVLPTYMFDANIVEAVNFGKFDRALTKKGGKYLITSVASGANYYFKREEIRNKLDLFVIETDSNSLKAEKNVKDVLELFGNKISFTKSIVSEAEKEKLSKELGITSFPVFLVNNQLKFGGIRSPESIKEKFCELNKLEECENELSESIK